MVLNTNHALGWKARDFALQGVDGRTYSLAEVRGPKGALVVFICNHCPYVKASALSTLCRKFFMQKVLQRISFSLFLEIDAEN